MKIILLPTLDLRYVSTVLADGPVAYWRLGESVGSTLVDEISSFNDSGQVVFNKHPSCTTAQVRPNGAPEKHYLEPGNATRSQTSPL